MDKRPNLPVQEHNDPKAEYRLKPDAAGFESLADAAAPGRNPSVWLICPNEASRNQLKRTLEAEGAKVTALYDAYPGYAQLPSLLDAGCDAYVVEIDTAEGLALDLVETICARKPSATVMVYSNRNAPDLMVAAMRAGAREFLSGTAAPVQLRAALIRAAARNLDRNRKAATGKAIVFCSAKGGSGVSTLAANFAMALRVEAAEPVLLADLNPQIGTLSVLLGITPRFTVVEALKSAKRLDSEFLSTLVTEHKSGISFIGAPDTFNASSKIEDRAVGKFVDVLKHEYPWVVIDAGPSLGSGLDSLFQMASIIYLVTQLDIPSLHNAQRFISYIQAIGKQRIELVINRYDARRAEFDDERVASALGVAPKWKIPNDYAAAYRTANTGNALILEKSPAAQALHMLARSACGKSLSPAKRKPGWSLFG